MSGRKIMMATEATHKLGDISRDTPGFCLVGKETDTHYIGSWITGFGFFDVHFPKATTRELTPQEKEYWRGKQVTGPAGNQDIDVDYERPLVRL